MGFPGGSVKARNAARSAVVFVCLALLGSLARAAAQDVRIYEPASSWESPELVSTTNESLWFTEPAAGRYRARSFYYTGLLGEGCFYVISIFHWRYSLFDDWGMAIVASDAEGHRFVHEGRIRGLEVAESMESQSIRFGENIIESEGATSRIRLHVGEFRCDLTLRSLLPPWTPGDGYAILGANRDAYLRKAVPVPLAETSGTLCIGETTITAGGWSYGDRSLTVAPLGELAFAGSAFRVFSERIPGNGEPWSLALLDYTSVGRREGRRIPMLLVAHGSEWILTSREYRISYEGPMLEAATPFSRPIRIHLSADSRGFSLEGDFVPERLVASSDVFEELPALVRGVASLFLERPVLVRMFGRFVGTLRNPDGTVESLRLAGQGDYFTVR